MKYRINKKEDFTWFGDCCYDVLFFPSSLPLIYQLYNFGWYVIFYCLWSLDCDGQLQKTTTTTAANNNNNNNGCYKIEFLFWTMGPSPMINLSSHHLPYPNLTLTELLSTI